MCQNTWPENLLLLQAKRKREVAALDYNMNMVSYFVPLMGEAPSLRAKRDDTEMVEI